MENEVKKPVEQPQEMLDFESEIVAVQPEPVEETPIPTQEDAPEEKEDFSAPVDVEEELPVADIHLEEKPVLEPSPEDEIPTQELPPEMEEPGEVVAPLKNMAGETITGQEEVAGPTPTEDIKISPNSKVEVKPIMLYFPTMYPMNGRIITIGIKMDEVKTKGGIIIVPKGITRDNYDRLRSNPNEDMMYFIVSMCPTVNHNLKANGMLPKRHNQFIPLNIGDQIITSPNMEPAYHREMDQEGLKEFWVWHYSDIFGFRMDPGNLQEFDARFGPKPKAIPFRKEK